MEILYEDDLCLAVLKPAGLPTQAPREFDSLERQVRSLLAERAAAADQTGEPYLGLPHRLDRAVSGAVLFAKTRRAARTLSRQFERRQVGKIYWACVERIVEPSQGTWIDCVRKVPDQPRSEIVPASSPGAQQAVLHYRVLESRSIGVADAAANSWLEIELETGRMHQIRLQAGSRGHPVLGDAMYGSNAAFGPPADDERERQIALHGRALRFTQPDTRQPITVVAPLPPVWTPFGQPTDGEFSASDA
ncbi:MAG TPA: RluA family pseudouridine synthase [Pirellulales bacterium]|nr:RluA family pseudouridine synthase [Pirellulales bacterium]